MCLKLWRISLSVLRHWSADATVRLTQCRRGVQVRGTVSARTWLVIAYLSVLHFALMASFTRRNDLDALCAGFRGGRDVRLPGT